MLTVFFGVEVEYTHYPRQLSTLLLCPGSMKVQVMRNEENPTWEKADSTRHVAIPLLIGHYPTTRGGQNSMRNGMKRLAHEQQRVLQVEERVDEVSGIPSVRERVPLALLPLIQEISADHHRSMEVSRRFLTPWMEVMRKNSRTGKIRTTIGSCTEIIVSLTQNVVPLRPESHQRPQSCVDTASCLLGSPPKAFNPLFGHHKG